MSFVSENRSWVDPYVREIASYMNLANWRIDIGDEPPEPEGRQAQILVSCEGRWAEVRFSDPEGDRGEFRNSVVHELMHLHLDAFEHTALDAAVFMGREADELYRRTLHYQLEITNCAITRFIAEMMPLPDFPQSS